MKKDAIVVIRMTRKEIANIDAIARKQSRSRSNLLRKIIKEKLR